MNGENTPISRKPALMLAPKWQGRMVSKALTMIKGALPFRFPSMRQADRIGNGIIA
jgi:hypothetical protein